MVDAVVCWLDDENPGARASVLLKHTTRVVRGIVGSLDGRRNSAEPRGGSRRRVEPQTILGA
ncbi:hypothetical protein QJS66_19760 [Kocuria rhizophila]|nr:hypothetical protein QJS66_19760 [Kocuria rhizophila]